MMTLTKEIAHKITYTWGIAHKTTLIKDFPYMMTLTKVIAQKMVYTE